MTLHEPVPEQAPPQPVNADPDAGLAPRLTEVPAANVVEHVVPQLIPAGALVMVPLPVPAKLTPSVNSGTNVAPTAVSEVIVTVQAAVPVQAAPLQPANTDPGAAVGVKVTTVPELKSAEHAAPQLIPAGVLVTVPVPAPLLVSERVNCGGGGGAKFATTA